MRIIERTYQWARPLKRRGSVPRGFKVHHAAASKASPDDIHRWHLARDWSGIGYHYHIGTSGTITRGRPEWAIGSHTLGFNDALGVVLEGNFEQTPPTAAQMASLSWLFHAHVRGQWPKLKASRHRDHAATACPGRLMPWPIPLPASGSLLSPGAGARPTRFRITVPSNLLTRQRIRTKMTAATGYRWHDGPRGTLQTTGDAKALAHIRKTSPYRVYWEALP